MGIQAFNIGFGTHKQARQAPPPPDPRLARYGQELVVKGGWVQLAWNESVVDQGSQYRHGHSEAVSSVFCVRRVLGGRGRGGFAGEAKTLAQFKETSKPLA